MSEYGYQHKRRRGVTGSRTQTCGAAAAERISVYDLEDSTYLELQSANSIRPWNARTYKKRMTGFYEHLAEDMQLESWREFEFIRVHTNRGLHRAVGSLANAGYDIVLELTDEGSDETHPSQVVTHSVGLLPILGEHYLLRSTWVFPQLRGAQTLERIFPYLATLDTISYSRTYPFNDANVIGIPKE